MSNKKKNKKKSKKGHDCGYLCSPIMRTERGVGCPKCAMKKDEQSKNTEFVKERVSNGDFVIHDENKDTVYSLDDLSVCMNGDSVQITINAHEDFENETDEEWQAHYEEVQAFVKEHGRLPEGNIEFFEE